MSNLMLDLFGKWEHKLCKNRLGHMAKMADMHIKVKTFNNLLQNQESNDLET